MTICFILVLDKPVSVSPLDDVRDNDRGSFLHTVLPAAGKYDLNDAIYQEIHIWFLLFFAILLRTVPNINRICLAKKILRTAIFVTMSQKNSFPTPPVP